MTFELIPITERLPDQDNFKHHLDSIVFYDVNGVKFLFNKKRVLGITSEEWINRGFEYWLEEIKNY